MSGIVVGTIVSLGLASAQEIISRLYDSKLDDRAMRKLLDIPAEKLRSSVMEFCVSEHVDEAEAKLIFERVVAWLRKIRLTLSQFLPQCDAEQVFIELQKRPDYHDATELLGADRHLFDQFAKAMLDIIAEGLIQVRTVRHLQQTGHVQSTERFQSDMRQFIGSHSTVDVDLVEQRDFFRTNLEEELEDEVRVVDEKVALQQFKSCGEAVLQLRAKVDAGGRFSGVSHRALATALVACANYYCGIGDYEEAERLITAARRLDSGNVRGKIVAAATLIGSENYEEALYQLEGVEDERAAIFRMNTYLELGRHSEASGEAAFLAGQTSARALSALAQYYLFSGDASAAEAYARRAVAECRNADNLLLLGRAIMYDVLQCHFGERRQFDVGIFMATKAEDARLTESREVLSEALEHIRENNPGDVRRHSLVRHELLSCLILCDRSAAVNLALEILGDDPADRTAVHLALTHGCIDEAATILEHVDIAGLNKEEDVILVGSLLTETNRPSEAVRLFNEWRQDHEIADHRQWTSAVARAFRRSGDAEASMRSIQDFIAGHPDSEDGQLFLALHFAETGDKTRAEPAVEGMLAIDRSTESLVSAWAILRDLGNTKLLRSCLEEIVDRLPHLEFYGRLFSLYFSEGDHEAVLKVVVKARARGVDDVLLDRAEGTALMFQGEYVSAKSPLNRAYEASRALGSDDQIVGLNLAICCLLTDEELRALSLLDELLKQPEPLPECYGVLAGYYRQSDRPELAWQYVREAARRFPDREDVQAAVFVHGFDLGHDDEAGKALREFLKRFPSSQILQSMSLEGAVELIKQNRERAETCWREYQQGKFPRVAFGDLPNFSVSMDWVTRTTLNEETETFPKLPVYVSPGQPIADIAILDGCEHTGIVLDYTALLTLESLGVLEEVAAAVGTVYFPERLLGLIAREHIDTFSGQKSKIDQRTKIAELVSRKAITVEEISRDVGRECQVADIPPHTVLAIRVADAAGGCYLDEYVDRKQVPVEWYDRLVDVGDIVSVLQRAGELSPAEAEEIFSRLATIGHNSRIQAERSARLSKDTVLIAGLSSLELLGELELLDKAVSVFSGGIRLTSQEFADVQNTVTDVRMRAKTRVLLEAIQRRLASGQFTPCSMAAEDRVLGPGLDGGPPNLSVAIDMVNTAIKRRLPLVVDDRAIRKLNLPQLIRGGSLLLLAYLKEKGLLREAQYQKCYLRMLEWNCLFVTLEPNVVSDILRESSWPAENSKLKLLRRYYSAASMDPGLSRMIVPHTSLQCEAIRFFTGHNIALIHALFSVWSDSELTVEAKAAASNFALESLWQPPDYVIQLDPNTPTAPIWAALWHAMLVMFSLDLRVEDALEFGKWYEASWIGQDVLAEPDIHERFCEQMLVHLCAISTDAPGLLHRLHATLPARILEVLHSSEEIKRIFSSAGLGLTRVYSFSDVSIPVDETRALQFRLLERVWLRRDYSPMEISVGGRPAEVRLVDDSKRTLMLGIQISGEDMDAIVAMNVSLALRHTSPEIRSKALKRLRSFVLTQTEAELQMYEAALLSTDDSEMQAAVAGIQNAIDEDKGYFLASVRECVAKQMKARLWPAGNQVLEKDWGLDEDAFRSSERFAARFMELMERSLPTVRARRKQLCHEVAEYIRRFFPFPFGGELSPSRKLLAFLDAQEIDAGGLIAVADAAIGTSNTTHNPVFRNNCLSLLLSVLDRLSRTQDYQIPQRIIKQIGTLIGLNCLWGSEADDCQPKATLYNLYWSLLLFAFDRLSIEAQDSDLSYRTFYSFSYAHDMQQTLIECLGGGNADRLAAERITADVKKLIGAEPTFNPGYWAISAGREVLYPPAMEVVGASVLGTLQVLSQSLSCVARFPEQRWVEFAAKCVLECTRTVEGFSATVRPYNHTENAFQSDLSTPVVTAAVRLLREFQNMRGPGKNACLDETIAQIGLFLPDNHIEHHIGKIETEDAESIAVALAVLVQYSREPVPATFAPRIAVVLDYIERTELSQPEAAKTSSLLLHHLAINAPDDSLKTRARRLLLRATQLTSSDVTVFEIHAASVLHMLIEESRLDEFGPWLEGVLKEASGDAVLRRVLSVVERIRQQLDIHRKTILLSVLQKVRSKL